MRSTPLDGTRHWRRPTGCWQSPLSTERLRRAASKSALLVATGWRPKADPTLLRLLHATEAQSGLPGRSGAARRLRRGTRPRAATRGQRVVLIDDVMTTGATLHAATLALRGQVSRTSRPRAWRARGWTEKAPDRYQTGTEQNGNRTGTEGIRITSGCSTHRSNDDNGGHVPYRPRPTRDPPNTGNVIRLAANTGCSLHLIEAAGVSMEDRQMRRAGLDYHEYASVQVHAGWTAFLRDTQPDPTGCLR